MKLMPTDPYILQPIRLLLKVPHHSFRGAEIAGHVISMAGKTTASCTGRVAF